MTAAIALHFLEKAPARLAGSAAGRRDRTGRIAQVRIRENAQTQRGRPHAGAAAIGVG
jgi:hypothetical protein